MTVYAEPVAQPFHSERVTRTFNVMVWVEMDRVRIERRFYTVTLTGQKGAAVGTLTYTIDGKPATMQDVAQLRTMARQEGSFELVAEEVAA